MAATSFFLTAPEGKEVEDDEITPARRASPRMPVRILPTLQSGGARAHVRKGSTSKPVFVHERFQVDELELQKFSLFGEDCLASSDEEDLGDGMSVASPISDRRQTPSRWAGSPSLEAIENLSVDRMPSPYHNTVVGENRLFENVISPDDIPLRSMQLRRKSSIILDRINIDAEEICIEDVDQEDWDFFDGLTTPRHHVQRHHHGEVEQSACKTSDSLAQSRHLNFGATEESGEAKSVLGVEPYKAPSVVHRVAFEQIRDSRKGDMSLNSSKLNKAPVSAGDVTLPKRSTDSQKYAVDLLDPETNEKWGDSRNSDYNEEAKAFLEAAPCMTSVSIVEDAASEADEGKSPVLSTSMPASPRKEEASSPLDMPPESPSSEYGLVNHNKASLMRQINAQAFASPEMARVIANAAEKIAEEEEAEEKESGSELTPLISTGTQMMGLLSQLRQAADHVGSARSSRKESGQVSSNPKDFQTKTDSKQKSSKLVVETLEMYNRAAEAKFEESVLRIDALYSKAIDIVNAEGKTSKPQESSEVELMEKRQNRNVVGEKVQDDLLQNNASDDGADVSEKVVSNGQTTVDEHILIQENDDRKDKTISSNSVESKTNIKAGITKKMKKKKGKKNKERIRRKKSKILDMINEEKSTPSMAIMRPSTASRELRGSRLEYLQLIGRGASSKVYLGRLWNSNAVDASGGLLPMDRDNDKTKVHAKEGRDFTLVAVKQIKLRGGGGSGKAKEVARVLRLEVDTLSRLSHRNIVAYKGLHFSKRRRTHEILMEFCDGGSLAKVVKRHPLGMSDEDLRPMITQIVDGLQYLHDQRVIHRDLKPANILFSRRGVIKIADFDISSQVCSIATKKRTCVGTANYCAPEVIQGLPCSYPLDVWSFGCTLIELASGKPPFHDCNAVQALFRMVETQIEISERIKGSLRDLITECLNRNPKARPTASEIRSSAFLVGDWATKSHEPDASANGGASATNSHGIEIDSEYSDDDEWAEDRRK